METLFHPVSLADSTGAIHEFHFRLRDFGEGVALDAFEPGKEYPAGYEFQLIGDPEADLPVLQGQLLDKMRRALSLKHLRQGSYGLAIGELGLVRGMIASDCAGAGESLPVLVIDGRPVEWEEFGRMLMTFEGSQFKLQIADQSEEI